MYLYVNYVDRHVLVFLWRLIVMGDLSVGVAETAIIKMALNA